MYSTSKRNKLSIRTYSLTDSVNKSSPRKSDADGDAFNPQRSSDINKKRSLGCDELSGTSGTNFLLIWIAVT